MPMVDADWAVNRSTKVISYIGDDHGGASPSYARVIEFHRWLQARAYEGISQGDDEIDATDLNPSLRLGTDNIIQLINGYTITNAETEHLFDGSIIQSGGDDIWDGFRNFGNADVQLQIQQNGAVLADDWWNFAGGGLNADAAQGISHQFLLPVRVAGADIDGRRVRGTNRRFGFTYGEFLVNGTARGNNTLANSDAVDLNNQTAQGTVAGWTTIVNIKEGYNLLDVNQDSTDEAYYSQWDRATFTINDLTERLKWLTRDGSVETLYGLNGELFRGISHEIDVQSGTQSVTDFAEVEALSWTGGTGQLLAVDDLNAANTMWIQLLTGSPPGDGVVITGGTSGATITTAASNAVTERPVATPFFGQSTGSALIGAFGLGVQITDLNTADSVISLLDGNPYSPPNFVTFTVNGATATETYLYVTDYDGVSTDPEGAPAQNEAQFSLASTLNTDNVSAITVSEVIPSDTPASGGIRLRDNNGRARKLQYSSWTAPSTFNITNTDGEEDFLAVNATAGNDVWAAYLDDIYDGTTATNQFTGIYTGADRDLVVQARDGGVTPTTQFKSDAVLGVNGGSINIIVNSDL